MGTKYLIDTNVVIEFLGAKLPDSGSRWLENLVENDLHCLSVINQIELLGFNGQPDEMQTLEDFINETETLPLSDKVVLKTIDIRKSHKIKLPDAIIAATAVIHKLTIITRNISDFDEIENLPCINAHLK